MKFCARKSACPNQSFEIDKTIRSTPPRWRVTQKPKSTGQQQVMALKVAGLLSF